MHVTIIRRSVLFLVAGVAGLGLCEILVRQFLPQIKYDYPPFAFRTHPDRGYEWQPGFSGEVASVDYRMPFSIDDHGFRVTVSPDTGRFILGVGDSLTFGKGVAAEQTWLNQTASALGIAGHNAGVDGYGPEEQLLLTRELLSHGGQPELIVAGVTLDNDFDDILRARRQVRHGILFEGEDVAAMQQAGWTAQTIDSIKMFFSLRSDLYHLVRGTVKTNRGLHRLLISLNLLSENRRQNPMPVSHRILLNIPDAETDSALARYAALVKDYRDLSRTLQIPIVFVLLPSWVQYDPDKTGDLYQKPCPFDLPESLLALYAAEQLPFVDAAPYFREAFENNPDLSFPRDGHWNPSGHRVAAQAVTEYLNRHYPELRK